jgi:hypothetical protein
VHWVRRSREGWRWPDGIDAPLAEETELYRIEIAASPSAISLSETLSQPQYLLPAAQLAGMRAAGRAPPPRRPDLAGDSWRRPGRGGGRSGAAAVAAADDASDGDDDVDDAPCWARLLSMAP